MMKVCLIGASGHHGYALDGIALDGNAALVGIAPGSKGEDIRPAYEHCRRNGGSPAIYEHYLQMLDELRPDVAVVDCYFHDHAAVGIAALERGCHLFMDKPVATTLEDLEKFKAVYRDSGKQMAGMFALRYSPPFYAGREAVQNGEIGEVRLLHAQKSYKLGQRGELYKKRELYGGTISWIGCHAIDWIAWFSGEKFLTVYAAHSMKQNQGHGDLEVSASCLFTMTNGVSATVSIDYLRPGCAPTHGDDRIRVVGSKGVLEVRDGNAFLTAGGGDAGTRLLELSPEKNIFQDFLEQLRGRGQCLASAEESIYASEAGILARISADEEKVLRFSIDRTS